MHTRLDRRGLTLAKNEGLEKCLNQSRVTLCGFGGAVCAPVHVATWEVYVTSVKMATHKLYCYACGQDISDNSSNRYNMFGSACEEALPIWKHFVEEVFDELEVDVNMEQLLSDGKSKINVLVGCVASALFALLDYINNCC